MKDIRLRIHLKSKCGEPDTIIYNDVFDLKTGIAFFPIDTELWDVVRVDRLALKLDSNDEIFEGDKLRCSENTGDDYVEGIVVYDNNSMSIKIEKTSYENIRSYDVGSCPSLYNFDNFIKLQ